MFLSFCGKSPRNEGAAFVAPNATVQGDVILKPGSTVWYGAVLRGDDGTLTLGENSNVQDNAVLHCDVGGAVTWAAASPWATAPWYMAAPWATAPDRDARHPAEPLRGGQKLHPSGPVPGAGRHGHPGRIGGRGRPCPGDQTRDRGTDRSQPAQRRALCGTW